MVDIMTTEQRSALMSRIRSVDTKPELFVRRALHALGYRFRTHVRGLPGRPDLVFTKRRAVIFVHGCFWHRHGCRKTTVPKVREEFWDGKFTANTNRDQRNQSQLAQSGWKVLIVWECEVENDSTLLDRIVGFLGPTVFGHK
ncbi:MAG: very short patch repair endonuclease [Gemmatimonadetes bacterium]|nr:very short patch repair endonuclease [Gemmatimonadota bacterium]